jgi:hypothetical protein
MIIMDSFSNDTDATGLPIKTERSSNHPETPEIVDRESTGPLPANIFINGHEVLESDFHRDS